MSTLNDTTNEMAPRGLLLVNGISRLVLLFSIAVNKFRSVYKGLSAGYILSGAGGSLNNFYSRNVFLEVVS